MMKNLMTKNINTRKLIYFLISLVAAVCLWLYVVGIVNPDGDSEITDIPVTFVGQDEMLEDRSLIISEGEDSTISIRVYGKWNNRTKLNSENVSATVDLSTVKSDGEVSLAYDLVLPDGVSEDDFNYIERENQYIDVTIQKLEKKTIELRGVLGDDCEISEGYMAKAFEFQPETIELMAAKEKLATISHALVTVNRTNINKTITDSSSFELISYEGDIIDTTDIILDCDSVEYTLPIVMTKEIPLVVEIVPGGGATEADTVKTIEPQSITISGDAEILDGISQIVLGTVDLSEVLSSETYEFPIVIPNETENLSGTDKASVTIKLAGLDTATLTTTQIEMKNLDESFTAYSLTQSVSVAIRAKSDEIESITANNIRLVADLSDISTEGRYQIAVKVYIDGYDDAGELGEYSIVVNVIESDAIAAETVDSVTTNSASH